MNRIYQGRVVAAKNAAGQRDDKRKERRWPVGRHPRMGRRAVGSSQPISGCGELLPRGVTGDGHKRDESVVQTTAANGRGFSRSGWRDYRRQGVTRAGMWHSVAPFLGLGEAEPTVEGVLRLSAMREQRAPGYA